MTTKVPATKPFFSEQDIDFITRRFSNILRGKSYLSMSKYGEDFEHKFAAYIGTKYAVTCNSGTSALELIFRAIDVSGKEVIIPSNTFLATAIAVINAGAKPVFADCADNMCLDAADAAAKITPLTAAVAIVHIGGIVSKSTLELREICKEKKIHLIEDAAQAHGSVLNGTKAGAFGTAAGFSFFSTKVMTTGEGGIVTTDDSSLVQTMKSIREFGKVKSGIYTNYHTRFGYNWRMLEVSALMGLRQLRSVESFIDRRQQIAKIYDRQLEGLKDIDIVRPEDNSVNNYFKYIIVLKNHDRARVHKAFEEAGICPSGYVYEIPLHKLPLFPEEKQVSLPKTEYLSSHHFCLPVFYGMTDEQVLHVANSLKNILNTQLEQIDNAICSISTSRFSI